MRKGLNRSCHIVAHPGSAIVRGAGELPARMPALFRAALRADVGTRLRLGKYASSVTTLRGLRPGLSISATAHPSAPREISSPAASSAIAARTANIALVNTPLFRSAAIGWQKYVCG